MTIDLQQFCAHPGEPREWLLQPFDVGGGVGATNGHFLVWMNREPVGHEPDPEAIELSERLIASAKAAVDMGERLAWSDPKAAHFVQSDCSYCAGTGIEDGECDECEGGEFTHGSHVYTCKACDGTGSIGTPGATCEVCCGTKQQPSESSIGNNETCISSVYVERLRMLPGCFVTSLPDEGRNFYFRFDGGVGVVAGFRGAALKAKESA